MNDQEQPRSGAGGTEGASVGPVESSSENASTEFVEEIEIPIGMPLPPAEVRRLKAAAEQLDELDEREPPAQSDAPDNNST